MTKKDLYDLIEKYKSYGVDPNSILGYKYDGPYDNSIRALINDLDNWNPVVAANKAKQIEKLIRLHGDKALNTFPGLVKDNHAIFFPDGKIPEDALEDYVADKHDPSEWVTLDDIIEAGVTPEDFPEAKAEFAKEILKAHCPVGKVFDTNGKFTGRLTEDPFSTERIPKMVVRDYKLPGTVDNSNVAQALLDSGRF